MSCIWEFASTPKSPKSVRASVKSPKIAKKAVDGLSRSLQSGPLESAFPPRNQTWKHTFWTGTRKPNSYPSSPRLFENDIETSRHPDLGSDRRKSAVVRALPRDEDRALAGRSKRRTRSATSTRSGGRRKIETAGEGQRLLLSFDGKEYKEKELSQIALL